MFKELLLGASLPSIALIYMVTRADASQVSLQGKDVFLGDSITYGLNVEAVSDNALNLAGNGWTILQVMGQIDSLYKPKTGLQSARRIILMIGVNDAYRRDAGRMIDDFKRLTSLMPDNVPVLLNAVLPIIESKTAQSFGKNWLGANTKIERLNSAIQNIATENEWDFVQFDISDTYFSDDGIHLNRKGYQAWTEELREHLGKPIL